jgi:hypothetical protein
VTLARIGLVVGIAGALAATPLIQGWLYGVQRTDPTTLAWVAGPERANGDRGAPASLSTEVIDAATGSPLLRVTLFSRDSASGGDRVFVDRADTTGFLRADSITPGVARHFEVTCEINQEREKLLDSITVTLKPDEVRRWNVRASVDGCDQRPFIVRTGEFAGLWKSGTGESSFTSCDLTIPYAWVDFRAGALETAAAMWPGDLDRDSSPAFVRWEATVIGPWHYGPKNDADFDMFVRRIYEVKGPKPGDCKR